MTERKFTPPEQHELPKEYRNGDGLKCVVAAMLPNGRWLGWVVKFDDDLMSMEWDSCGMYSGWANGDLHDIPAKPDVQYVELFGDPLDDNPGFVDGQVDWQTHRMTYRIVDGVLDLASFKVEAV